MSGEKVLCAHARRQRDSHALLCTIKKTAKDAAICGHVWYCPGDILWYNTEQHARCPNRADTAKQIPPDGVIYGIVPDAAEPAGQTKNRKKRHSLRNDIAQ